MIWRIRIALLTSVVMASAFCTLRADDKPADDKDKPVPEKKDDKKEPLAPPMGAPLPGGGGCGSPCGAPAYQTICVTEWVPEYYKTTRTTYKRECVPETYTAYRTECVPEVRTRNVTHYERVCETREVTKTVCERVCVQEERTCYKTHWTCVPVTTYTCKTVDHGHYECREVACSEGFFSRMRHSGGGLFGGHHHGDECGCGCENTCCAPPTKTVQVWVSCKETIQVPCTKMERKCETVCEKQMVNVWKSIPKTVVCKENVWKCVPVCKTETYTANVSRCIPYQATRMVSRCVPCTEEVTACRMVAKTVQKQVPVAQSCASPCNECCERESFGHRLRGWFESRRHHGGECGCEASCGGGSTCGCGH